MAEDLGLVWLHVVSPPDIENDLTSVSENWGNFGGGDQTEVQAPSSGSGVNTRANLNRGRSARFQAWMQRIVPGHRPALNFKHTLMPHVPWQYLPSGRMYRRQPNDAVPALSNQAYQDTGQLDVLLQRHFLQTGFADFELQELWKRLKSEGLWDKSLIVVAADHGVAFPHARERRRLSRTTAREIAPIPLFIKAPGQKAAKVNRSWVETIDILPTILDILNVDPKVHMDGKSAYSSTVKDRKTLRFEIRNTFETLKIPAATFERERAQIIARNHRLFGSGADGPQRIYEIGPHPELIGQPASAAGPPLDVELADASDYDNVDPSTGLRPDAHRGERERPRPAPARHRGGGERDDPGGGQHLHARGRQRGRAGLRDGAGVRLPQGQEHRPGTASALEAGARQTSTSCRRSSFFLLVSFGTYRRAVPICSAPSPRPRNCSAIASSAVR